MNNLLVTGGCGFIGANFVRFLFEEAGFQGRVVNADLLTYAGNPLSLADIEAANPERYVFRRADICDRAAMERIMDEFQIDAVAHFAAESHVDRSIVAPDTFVRTNVLGTQTLLDLCRRRMDRLEVFHHVSTDEVYGTLGEEGYFLETTPYAPSSPYSASKAASDHLVRAYHHTYGLPVTISNCSNNYGPYQFPEKLVPLMILNAIEGKPLPVYGDGRNVRDWLHVADHCRAVWAIMTRGRRGETYNVGGRSERRNLEVVGRIIDLVEQLCPALPSGPRRDLITFVKDRPGHDWRYAIDCTKLESELGWSPRETFDSGMEDTVRWYLAHRDWVESVRTGEYTRWIEAHYGKRA
mgnify:CR=1 FL=1|jgi:dTDP-glucose 4,6-dehydratase